MLNLERIGKLTEGPELDELIERVGLGAGAVYTIVFRGGGHLGAHGLRRVDQAALMALSERERCRWVMVIPESRSVFGRPSSSASYFPIIGARSFGILRRKRTGIREQVARKAKSFWIRQRIRM